MSKRVLRQLAVLLLLTCTCAGVALCQALVSPETTAAAPPSNPRLDLRDDDLFLLAGSGLVAVICKQIEDDEELSESLDQPYLDFYLDAGNTYGSGTTLGSAAVIMMGIGRLTSDSRLADTGDDLLRALVTAWVPVWSIKPALDVRRPNGGPYSFPSGHTATAFAAAPVFSYHGGRIVGILAHGAAAGTALGRLEDNMHHASDVLVGAAIGLIAGRLAVRAREAREPATPERDITVSSVPGGVVFALRF
jgi:hypothetical protein